MTWLLLGAGALLLFVAVIALCAMASFGDRQLEEARRNLAEDLKRPRLGVPRGVDPQVARDIETLSEMALRPWPPKDRAA